MQEPNVVVILADDLGFSDLGCFGGEIQTPNIDSLAAHGVRMSNFYVTPRCSPSRASLLTGRHPHEVGIGILTSDDRPRGYPGSLDQDVPTLGGELRDAGYETCLTGKWHLSADVSRPDGSWPRRRGFDDFFGIMTGSSSYFQPRPLYRNETRVDDLAGSDDFYFTTAITDHAEGFVRRSHGRDNPFFLYVAYTAPHWPLHAPPDAVEANRGRFDAGWDELREQRMRSCVEQGILPAGTTPSPRDPREPSWDDAPDPGWEARRMEVYAAQIELMDRGVGRLVDTLEELGELENTLILIMSDNGACDVPFEATPVAAFKDADTCPRTTRAGAPVKVGNDPSITPGPEDTFSTYGRAWANLSNTPFRLYKKWVHEGGIAAPLVAHWPQGGLVGGAVDHTPSQLTDIMPTILAAAGRPDLRSTGVSLLPQWRGHENHRSSERSLYWEHVGNAAIRRGRWKLVREQGRPWELYDLDADRCELEDRADGLPELVAELRAEWARWAARSGVIPWPVVTELYRERGQDARQAEGFPAR